MRVEKSVIGALMRQGVQKKFRAEKKQEREDGSANDEDDWLAKFLFSFLFLSARFIGFP
jgi:hypothetical protein